MACSNWSSTNQHCKEFQICWNAANFCRPKEDPISDAGKKLHDQQESATYNICMESYNYDHIGIPACIQFTRMMVNRKKIILFFVLYQNLPCSLERISNNVTTRTLTVTYSYKKASSALIFGQWDEPVSSFQPKTDGVKFFLLNGY